MDTLPVDLRQEVVLNATALDGHSLTTHRFRAAESPSALVHRLRARWHAAGIAVVETRHGDWTILSIRDPDGLQTVQLKATAHGTEGLSSRWQRGQSTASSGADAQAASPPTLRWLGDDARIVRRVAHHDPGRVAATVVAIVPGPPTAAAERLRERAGAAGFRDESAPVANVPARAPGLALVFRRGHEEVAGTVAPHRDGVAVVLHWSAAK